VHTGIRAVPFLAENTGLLPRGRALDIAMGNGRNTIYLARMGFEAEGVDISAKAVEAALEHARSVGVKISARIADLEAENYIIQKNTYDLIICFNYLYRPLIPRIKEGLKEGGIIVYETFTVDQMQFGRPSNPEFLLRHNELLEMFRGFRCLRYHEGITDKKAAAGIIAEKPAGGDKIS
jgi:2-polyprenyl-3-methyl-5-hydroxy-6-metoxy-1,4-benzoquinol methylase